MQTTQQRQYWNWMNCGPLCSKRRTKPGSGLPCVGRRVKSSAMPSGIEVKRPAGFSGHPFQKPIEQGTVLLIFGQPTRQSFQKSNIQQQERKQVKRHMLSAGITRCGNVWLVSFGKRSLSDRKSVV